MRPASGLVERSKPAVVVSASSGSARTDVLTLEDRSVIAHRAATLDERLARSRWSAPAARTVGTGTPFECAALKTWQRAFSGSDRDAFLRRLSWDGLDAWSLAAALTTSEPGHHTPPAWTTWLQRFGQYASALGRELTTCAIPPEVAWLISGSSRAARSRDLNGVRRREPPFVELWVPIVRAIYAELRYAGRTLVSTLPSPVRHGFQRAWLADIAAAGQHAAWDAFRAVRRRAGGSRQGTPAVACEPRAVRSLRRVHLSAAPRGARAALPGIPGPRSRPGADRRVCRRGGARVAAACRARPRPHRTSFPAGTRHRNADQSARSLVGSARRTAASDRSHVFLRASARLQAQRCHARQRFQRPGGMVEREWSGRCASSRPRSCRETGMAGPSSFERGECSSEREVHRAFDAAGVLLCLAWALGARDLHWQNVIATSGGPVLIDLETLLQPDGLGAADDECSSSVLGVAGRGRRRVVPHVGTAVVPATVGRWRRRGRRRAVRARRSSAARRDRRMEEPSDRRDRETHRLSRRRARPESDRAAGARGRSVVACRLAARRLSPGLSVPSDTPGCARRRRWSPSPVVRRRPGAHGAAADPAVRSGACRAS